MFDVTGTNGHFRVVMIGDSSVGKSSIVNRLSKADFDPHEPPTVGSTFIVHVEEVNGSPVQLQIWDTAGQERFRSLGPIYYRGAAAAIAVFDLANPPTFENLNSWISTFVDCADGKTVIVVLGNKLDLADGIRVDPADAKHWAETRGYLYFSTSAQSGGGIQEAITALARALAGAEIVESRQETPTLRAQEKGKCTC
jgi:small GTP-binding protein